MWENSLGSHSLIPIILSLLGNLSTYTSSLLSFVFAGVSLGWLQRRIRGQIVCQKAKNIDRSKQKINTVQ